MSLEKWAEFGWLRAEPSSRSEIRDLLELTIQADAGLIHKMRVFSKKRNATSYDAAANVSAQELEQMIEFASELQRRVIAWLERNHPELAAVGTDAG
jgi:hypothetical protein